MTKRPTRTKDKPDRYFWAKPFGSDNDMEPVAVTHAGARPDQVWFTGSDVGYDIREIVLGREIKRPRAKG